MENYKSNTFHNGDLLAGLYFEGNESIEVGRDCDSIIVVLENGQMARVPWFEVWKDGEIKSKWNGALVQGVKYT